MKYQHEDHKCKRDQNKMGLKIFLENGLAEPLLKTAVTKRRYGHVGHTAFFSMSSRSIKKSSKGFLSCFGIESSLKLFTSSLLLKNFKFLFNRAPTFYFLIAYGVCKKRKYCLLRDS